MVGALCLAHMGVTRLAHMGVTRIAHMGVTRLAHMGVTRIAPLRVGAHAFNEFLNSSHAKNLIRLELLETELTSS